MFLRSLKMSARKENEHMLKIVTYLNEEDTAFLKWLQDQAQQHEMAVGKYILLKSDLRREYRMALEKQPDPHMPASTVPKPPIKFD